VCDKKHQAPGWHGSLLTKWTRKCSSLYCVHSFRQSVLQQRSNTRCKPTFRGRQTSAAVFNIEDFSWFLLRLGSIAFLTVGVKCPGIRLLFFLFFCVLKRMWGTVFPRIEAWPWIQAGGSDVIVLIEAGGFYSRKYGICLIQEYVTSRPQPCLCQTRGNHSTRVRTITTRYEKCTRLNKTFHRVRHRFQITNRNKNTTHQKSW